MVVLRSYSALRTIGLASALLLLIGCTGQETVYRSLSRQPVEKPQVVGVESVEDQARTAVVASETDFVVPPAQAAAAWERGKLFFARYTSSFDTAVSTSSAGKSNIELSNKRAAADAFLYTLQKRELKNGVRFSLNCTARDARVTSDAARMNARNVARFVRDGTLELSLLHR